MDNLIVVLNGDKMNFDGVLDYASLGENVRVYDDTKEEELLDRIAGASIVITKEMEVSHDTLMKFPDSVKLIVEAGTGYNNLDLPAAEAKHITVCNIPAYSTDRVADTAIMFILNLASCMRKQMAMLARNDHRNFSEHLMVPHHEVNGLTLGVVGEGNIGQAVIRIALALGMKVLVSTRHPKNNPNVTYVSLEELLKQSDYVSLHCALNKDTYHMIGKDELAMMKPSACIINTARGALIDEAALAKALSAHQLAGAGLDVFETEPLPEDSPFYDMENVIITPHMGWKGIETRKRLLGIIKDDIDGFLNHRPINVVTKQR